LKAVVLGGTSGLGRELARCLVERGDNVFLLGRSLAELARSANDLQARHPRQEAAGFAECDLERPELFAGALDTAAAALGGFDTVVVTAAMFASQEALEADVELTWRLTTVNFSHTIVFCEHARKRLLAQGGGKLVVFSSVAGDRGRKPVAIYGATKAGLATYLEALDHRYHSAGLTTLCVKPGFVHTEMTAGLKAPPFAGQADRVARQVMRAMDEGKAEIYVPAAWGAVMAVIRRLPRFVMRRVGF
jgi:decaprenylphospho-beta-D-erythro-pentofuranosid-2-ulose 2-reductase